MLSAVGTAQVPFNRSLLRPDAARTAPAGGPFATAVARARSAVVHVFVEVAGANTFKLERPSSGVAVSADGLVLTHWDLVREAAGATDKRVFVQLADGRATRLPARIVTHDVRTGLALVRADVPAGVAWQPVDIADGCPLGEPVVVLSYGDGEDQLAFAGVAAPAVGDVLRADGTTLLDRDELLLTDAPIQQRVHGAPLLDRRGALVGLCNAERVLPEIAEPTLEDLKRPSFGFVLPVATIVAAFGEAWPRAHVPAVAPSPLAKAVAIAAPAVVAVRSGEAPPLGESDPYAVQRRRGAGSGVVIDAMGLVLTNRHVVVDADSIDVVLDDGTACRATLVGEDRATNTALLRVAIPAGRTLTAVPCGTPSALAVGGPVVALGNPVGGRNTVCAGVLSARRDDRLQVDVATGNQNGGGALVDEHGMLVGIVDGGARDKLDLAFAHRGDQAKVESSLNLVPGIDTVLGAYADVLRRLGSTVAVPARDPSRDGAIPAVVERVGDSMLNIYVAITTEQAELDDNPFAAPKPRTVVEGLGSGVIVDPSGLALTNWHVVDSATDPDGSMRGDRVVHVALRDGTLFPARVLSISREEDLALLQLELEPGRTVKAVELGASDRLRVGDTAIAIGNPHGRANTVTAGVVSAKNQAIRVRGRWAKLPNLLETDAAINAGNSGGALLDGDGALIGINSAGGSLHSVTGFAIAVDHVRDVLHRILLSPEKLRSPYFGLSLGDDDDGVFVAAVDPTGPAATAGIATGDVLRTVGGVPVAASVRATLALLHAPDGAPTAFGIVRAGTARDVAVTPRTAAAWAVFRQIGCDVREFALREDPARVQAAATAFVRAFTKDPTAAPSLIPASLVRIERVDAAVTAAHVDVAAGDLLLGIELAEELAGGAAGELIRFEMPADVQRCIDAHGSYEGTKFRAWIERGGKVFPIELPGRRLML